MKYYHTKIISYKSTIGEHTYVHVTGENKKRGIYTVHKYGCFGGIRSKNEVESNTVVGNTPVTAVDRASLLVSWPDWNDKSDKIPIYSDLRYGLNGVCHQAANRVCAALCFGGPVPEVDIEQVPSYFWSKMAYGRYGTDFGPSQPWGTTLTQLLDKIPLETTAIFYALTGMHKLNDETLDKMKPASFNKLPDDDVIVDSVPDSVVAEFTPKQKKEVAHTVRKYRTRLLVQASDRYDKYIEENKKIINTTSKNMVFYMTKHPSDVIADEADVVLESFKNSILRKGDTPAMAQYNTKAGRPKVVRAEHD